MLKWILPEHGPAGLLVEAFNVAAHDIDELIDNLSATMVSKDAYKAMQAVHSDFTCDDPKKIEVVTEALVSVLNRYSSKYDPLAVNVELRAPDHREATIPTPRAPPKPVEAVEVPTESGPAKKRRRLDDYQTRPEQVAPVPFFVIITNTVVNINKTYPARSSTHGPMGTVTDATLKRADDWSGVKNRAYVVCQVTRRDGYDIKEEDLKAICNKGGYKYFYSAASANIAWFVLAKPASFSVDFAAVMNYYTFQAGGRVSQKVGKFLYEVFAATSTHFGTFTFDVSAATTYTWKDATEHVKLLTPDQWLELKAENKRLVKLETATEFQALLHLWASELKEFLQHVWNANATTRPVTERPARGQRWKAVPP